MTIKSSIRRHSIATYFVLAYGISWSIILVVAALKGFRPDAIELQDGILMFLAMLLGPSLAGITMTAVLERRSRHCYRHGDVWQHLVHRRLQLQAA